MNKEKGFILPVVMVLIALMSSLFLFASMEWSKWKQQDLLRLKMIQAGYAAESGIAERQVELQDRPDDYRTEQTKYGDYTVNISVWESVPESIFIQAVAKGKDNIQQTKTVEIDKKTMHILYWLE
ncbi:type II secretion system GspH family protein [Shimazuella sp. AN120528]|uniref:type II secretion system GspH family protein n=1 Tax=Shimazuella soli TaxID=1892854 RepID=UPI001F0DBF4B|nr:type II secretion system GspH family protein [Shimazuella soli]MCH5583919.1 type II secretion system GspH family protein [Shimazuella soli]